MVASFFIPPGPFGKGKIKVTVIYLFISYSMALAMTVIGMIGGFLFILIQLLVLVDFAHSWAESWLVI